MKKLIASFVVFLGMVGLSFAEVRSVPMAPSGEALQSAAYGGVEFTTLSVNALAVSTVGYTNIVTNTDYSNRNVMLYGVFFTSGSCLDSVSVFTSSSGFDNRTEVTRIYNISASTASAGTGACSGFSGLQFPLRLEGNVFARNSIAGYTGNLLLYWKKD